MKEINFSLLFIVAVSIAIVNPVDAVCIDNKISVYTNIKDAFVTIKAHNPSTGKPVADGETWDIKNGYNLKVQSIDVENETVYLTFKINADTIDKQKRKEGETFIYSTIFRADIGNIFRGPTDDMVIFRDVYFLSEPFFWKTFLGTTSMKSNNLWYWQSDEIYNFNNYETWKVSYSSIEGYISPENETKTLAGKNCIEFVGIYTGGDITIESNIAEASYIITGPGGYSNSGSGTSWNDNNVMGGSYTVTFIDVGGYTTPSALTQIVTPGKPTSFSAPYTALATPTATKPTTTPPLPTPTATKPTTTPPLPTPTATKPTTTPPLPTPTLSSPFYMDPTVICALIAALASIIVAYFGYRAIKK